MNARYNSAPQPHLVVAGLMAMAMGIYYFAIQSNSPSSSPSVENFESVDGSPAWSGESPNEMHMTTGVSAENGESEILPPTQSMVSHRSDREQPSRATIASPLEFGRNGTDFSQTASPPLQGDIQVFFSPKGGCTTAIVAELNRAQHQVMVQAYSFTSEPIAAACVAAHHRGVQVFAVLDKSQESEQYSAADFLVNSGITTLIDSQHAIAHNKVILIDGQTLITGSFNFTTNAEQSNAENLLIIRNHPALYHEYEKNLQHHAEHSKPHVPRGSVNNSADRGSHPSKKR